MVRIPAGENELGSEDFFPEERPVRTIRVEAFWMDAHQVTVADFRRFVKDTGYVTHAERDPDPSDYEGADPSEVVAGGLVFVRPPRPVPLDDWRQWWRYVPGANWRRPQGPDGPAAQDRHPVTQIARADALAYAQWAGKSLPTEAEWEYAARGGLRGKTYSWGDDFEPRGRRMANTWVGRFPSEFVPGRGQAEEPGTTPVGTYPPNGYGLFDVAGNVWEWTADEFTADHSAPASPCCGPAAPAPTPEGEAGFRQYVIKGGSHLCAPNYCLRYRPAARQAQDEDTSTVHIGFRCVVRDPAGE